MSPAASSVSEAATLAKYYAPRLEALNRRVETIFKRGSTIPANLPGIDAVGQRLTEARDLLVLEVIEATECRDEIELAERHVRNVAHVGLDVPQCVSPVVRPLHAVAHELALRDVSLVDLDRDDFAGTPAQHLERVRAVVPAEVEHPKAGHVGHVPVQDAQPASVAGRIVPESAEP